MRRGPSLKQQIVSSTGVAEIPVASTATVYTKSFSLRNLVSLAAEMLPASDGTVKLAVTLEQSSRKPVTEGAADTYWVEPDSSSTLITHETKAIRSFVCSPLALEYGRFKIVGGSGNDATTTTQMWISTVEEA